MLTYKKIKIGKRSAEAIVFKLAKKNLVVIRARGGYVMCGYLNLAAANKFGDVAVTVVGVSSIKDVLASCVHSLTVEAKKLGIHKNQPIKDVLKIII